MKKRTVMALLFVIFILGLVLGLVACGLKEALEGNHEHAFLQHNTDAMYLKSEATCTSMALYYYSCTCGEKGEEVFVSGKPLGHTGGIATCVEPATCERCGEKYGKIAYNNHSYIDGVCSLCDEPRTSGLDYILSADKTCYSIKRGGSSAEKVYIPAKYKGKPVTSVADEAFRNCSTVKTVVIPDSIKEIGDSAFYNCKALTDINIPDSVKNIGDSAFYGCKELTAVTIPKSITRIGNKVFCDCWSLVNVNIPDSVTSIGFEAFKWCMTLKNITIPDSVTSIGNSAFCDCYALTDITIPSSVTSIGGSLFDGCSSLANVTIPNSVTSIGSSAFNGCTKLTSITIPDSVTEIGNYAFYYCQSLASITIPASVTAINDGAFSECNNLTDVYYAGSNEDWAKIKIGAYNNNLINATVTYTYKH